MKKEDAVVHKGFAPVIDDKSVVLILGSFPSVKSRESGFYYGNPSNRFWKTIAAAVGEDAPNDTEDKKTYLKKHGIALFDVIEESSLTGSSDGDITHKNSKSADLKSVIALSDNLRLIICNGKKAFSVFNEVCEDCPCPVKYLSSTSAANPSFKAEEWIAELKDVLKYYSE